MAERRRCEHCASLWAAQPHPLDGRREKTENAPTGAAAPDRVILRRSLVREATHPKLDERSSGGCLVRRMATDTRPDRHHLRFCGGTSEGTCEMCKQSRAHPRLQVPFQHYGPAGIMPHRPACLPNKSGAMLRDTSVMHSSQFVPAHLATGLRLRPYRMRCPPTA